MKSFKHNTRFFVFVSETDYDVCWPWLGPVDKDGYGMFHGKRAARVAYKIAYGNLSDNKRLHHICQNKPCVNQRHLVALSSMNHPDDGAAINRNKTHCKNGHVYDVKNTYFRDRFRRGKLVSERDCISCRRENSKKYRENQRRITR